MMSEVTTEGASPAPPSGPPAAGPGPQAARAEVARRWPLSRIVSVAVLALLLFSVAAVVAGGLALLTLRHDRERVVVTLDPAALAVQQLDIALLNQETGVRGYALSGQQAFLAPYTQGQAAEMSALATLRGLQGQLPPGSQAEITSVVNQAHYWRTHYAEPAIAAVTRSRQTGDQSRHHRGKGGF